MTDDINAPHIPLPTQTVVTEPDGAGHLLWFEGLLPLPVGARINLDNVDGLPQVPLDPERFPSGHADAVVRGVKVWGTQGAGRCLVLEVELEAPGGELPPPTVH